MAGRSFLLISAFIAVSSCHGSFLRSAKRQLDVETPAKATSCSALKNQETFSTVAVKVGTPPQSFDLVADTGSDDVIVQSCICQAVDASSGGWQTMNSCPKSFGSCFTGTNKSKTFHLEGETSPQGPAVMLLSFGSGDIETLVASDSVTLGQESARMDNSLLLMIKQNLDFSQAGGQEFEGILGLGRPKRTQAMIQANTSRGHMAAQPPPHPAGQEGMEGKIKGFLEASHTDRFSMCFNWEGDGVLGLNTKEQTKSMGSVGSEHWGLDFRGISVGNASQPVTFCNPASKKKDQETACGMIPDSGTTLMMGPEQQILSLYDQLCKAWPRCQETHTKILSEIKKLPKNQHIEVPGLGLIGLAKHEGPAPAGAGAPGASAGAAGAGYSGSAGSVEDIIKEMEKVLGGQGQGVQQPETGLTKMEMAETFQLLVENCGSWMNGNVSVDKEMPSLFFQVAGKGGQTDTLEMTPSSWVMETKEEVLRRQVKKFMGVIPIEVITKSEEKVCMPAFGPMEYPTQLNGDIWIMGTPLFYEYNVNYDRAPDPPSIFFDREACGSCIDSTIKHPASLLSDRRSQQRSTLRKLNSPPVTRKLDPSRPF